MVKHDFKSGAIVTLTMPTSMPIVSTVVLLMIMSYIRSYPRTRTLLRPHANVIALPRLLQTQRSFLTLTTCSDQASTAAPADDELSVFGREEALRLDEEIMDFRWFETVTWDSIEDLRDTTYVQPPPRCKFALQPAQHAIFRAITHHGPTSLASETAWKVLVRNSWLLLGRPAVNSSESNCAHFLGFKWLPR